MRFKVFTSSVQREFAAERQMLAEYVCKDALATPQYKPDSAIFHTIIWRKTTKAAVNKARSTPSTGGVVSGVEVQSGTSQGQVAGGVGITAESVVARSSCPVAYQNVPDNVRSRLQKYRLTEKGRQMLAQKGTHE